MDFFSRLVALVLAVFLTLLPGDAQACLYFSAKIKPSSFQEKDREALLFHDGEAANLILKTGFSGKLPPKLAWVFPLPNKPLGYKVTSRRLFKTLNNYFEANDSFDGALGGRGLGAPKSMPKGGIKVHEAAQVGQYEIIPIEILADSAGRELNDWLKNQGFITSPLEIQRPYLKKGAFFLAIRADLAGSLSDLEPLWIRYKDDQLSFPLRFTHEYRSFNLKVYFLMPSGKKVLSPQGHGWDGVPTDRLTIESMDRYKGSPYTDDKGKLAVTEYDQFDTLMNLLTEFRDVPAVVKFLDQKNLVLTRIIIKEVNSEKTPKLLRTKNLTSDPSADSH